MDDLKKWLSEKGLWHEFVNNVKYHGSYASIEALSKEPKDCLIMRAFTFDETSEGHVFWWDIDEKWKEEVKK